MLNFRRMFKRCFFLLLPVLLATCAAAVAADWQTDYARALQMAKAQNKRVLLDFTGSDWCPLCFALRKRVFVTPAFQAYAQKNLILVEIDYPRRKKQPAGLTNQNERLAKDYGIDDKGFPTVVLLDPAGKAVREFSGYDGENTADLISWIEGKKKM
jgi:thioredoxin-related protein